MKTISCLLVFLVFLPPAAAGRPRRPAAAAPMEVDAAEVKRCGDQCEFVNGHTAAATPAATVSQAMAPPGDDSDKFFVSIIQQPGDAVSQQLLDDWQRSQWLQAVGVPGGLDSWSHCTIYAAGDNSQDWRWADISFEGLPSVVITAPRSGVYGDAASVVYQSDGYDGDARGLAEAMTSAIRQYVAVFADRVQAAEPTATAPPPWETEEDATPRTRPLVDRVPRIPPAERPLLRVIPWGLLVSGLAGGVTLPLIVGAIIFALRRVRSYRVAAGINTILTDDQMARLIDLLNTIGVDEAEPDERSVNKKRSRKKPR